ncbi:MAG: hypothetical protein U0Q15_04370 [Kineosporiaceae bacterium]
MATNLLLEGDDLEALLARAAQEGGPTARIVRAEKVRRGGVLGFFAREGFEVAVEIPDVDGPAPAAGAAGRTGTAGGSGGAAAAGAAAAAVAAVADDPPLSQDALARLAARIEAAEQASAGSVGAALTSALAHAAAVAQAQDAAEAVSGPRRLFPYSEEPETRHVPGALGSGAGAGAGSAPGADAAPGRRVFAYHEAAGGTPAVARALAVLDQVDDLVLTTDSGTTRRASAAAPAPAPAPSPSDVRVPGLAERLAALDLADGPAPVAGPEVLADALEAILDAPTKPTVRRPAPAPAPASAAVQEALPAADTLAPAVDSPVAEAEAGDDDPAPAFTTLLDTLRASGKVTLSAGGAAPSAGHGAMPGTTILPGGVPAQPARGGEPATSWAIPSGFLGAPRAAAAYADVALPTSAGQPPADDRPGDESAEQPYDEAAEQPADDVVDADEVVEPDEVVDVVEAGEVVAVAEVTDVVDEEPTIEPVAVTPEPIALAPDPIASAPAPIAPEPVAVAPVASPAVSPATGEAIDAEELRALLSVPENPQTRVRRPVDTRLAADRRTLRGLGVPGAWTRRLKAGDRFSSVMSMLAPMPELDADPDVPVVAVVGLPGDVVMEAHRVAVDLAVGNRPRRVVVVPTDDAPQRDAALDRALEMDNLVAAVETLALDATHASRVRATLRQLRAALVIAVVDASRPLEETKAWLAGIGRVDALAVEGAMDVVDPAATLRLNLPVIRLDGIPVDRVTWTALLCAQLDLAERVR